MSEFKVTHQYVLQNNVRYMYSGLPLSLRYRGSGDYPNFDMLRINRENSDLKKLVLQSHEYQRRMNTFLIPKAPAFRKYTRHAVDPVVDRLLKPTIAREGFSPEKHSDKFRCKEYTRDPDKSSFPSYQKLPEDQVRGITSRLLKPTHMSTLKQRLPPPPLRQDPDRSRVVQMHSMPIVDAWQRQDQQVWVRFVMFLVIFKAVKDYQELIYKK